jgi:hypothetical protein
VWGGNGNIASIGLLHVDVDFVYKKQVLRKIVGKKLLRLLNFAMIATYQ